MLCERLREAAAKERGRRRTGKANRRMKDTVYEKVTKYIDAQDMIAAGDFVAAGVSGGADSVCLLHMLWRLRTKRPFLLAAVHVNHGLRKEAEEDAAFVKGFVRSGRFPFFCGKQMCRVTLYSTGYPRRRPEDFFAIKPLRRRLQGFHRPLIRKKQAGAIGLR